MELGVACDGGFNRITGSNVDRTAVDVGCNPRRVFTTHHRLRNNTGRRGDVLWSITGKSIDA